MANTSHHERTARGGYAGIHDFLHRQLDILTRDELIEMINGYTLELSVGEQRLRDNGYYVTDEQPCEGCGHEFEPGETVHVIDYHFNYCDDCHRTNEENA